MANFVFHHSHSQRPEMRRQPAGRSLGCRERSGSRISGRGSGSKQWGGWFSLPILAQRISGCVKAVWSSYYGISSDSRIEHWYKYMYIYMIYMYIYMIYICIWYMILICIHEGLLGILTNKMTWDWYLWKSGDPEIWVFDQQRIGQVALDQTAAGLQAWPKGQQAVWFFLNMATNGYHMEELIG